MPDHRASSAHYSRILAQLAAPSRLDTLGPIAARFVYSLRLIALHQRARRDPVPELASRLGSIDVAAKSLALSQTITATWPENIHVSRFCCCAMTHDEATIGAMIEAALARNHSAFVAVTEGLIRPTRVEALWEAVGNLVIAEMSAA